MHLKKISLLFLLCLLLNSSPVFAQQGGEKPGTVKPITGETKSWPSSERLAFISECIKTAKEGLGEDSARFYCWCMQEKSEQKYPTIEEALANLTEAEFETPAWKKDIQDCLGGTWTTTNRASFLKDCIASAKDGVGEEKANKYCGCMLFKIEKMYPDHAEADKLTSEDLSSPAWKKIMQGCLDF